MKKVLLILFLFVVFGFNLSYAQCPQQSNDHGVCDTLSIALFDSANNFGTSDFPRKIYFPLYITHDVPDPLVDSIAAIVIPLGITHTNAAAYCSSSTYWNRILWTSSNLPRNIFRNMPNPGWDSTNWMMDLYNEGNGEEWNGIILDLMTNNDLDSAHWFLTAIPTGSEDRHIGDTQKKLLATMTLRVSDTMTIVVDTTLWAPSSQIAFANSDGATFIPRMNLPFRVFVGADTSYIVNQPPVVSGILGQTILEGQSFAPISLDNYVVDPDNPDSQITWTYWGNSALQVQIANRVASIAVPDSEWNGSESVWFKGCDPGGLCDSNQATFTVTAVNDPPVVSDIPNQTVLAGENFLEISLDNYVADLDNPDSQITWTYWGNTDLQVQIANRIATITPPSASWTGSETIWFKGCDPGGLCDSNEAMFTVNISGFSLDAIPETLRVARGYSGEYKAILTSINGFSSSCTLIVSGYPGGSTAIFNPPAITPTDSSVLTIHLPDTLTIEPCIVYPNTPVDPCTLNTYTLTITATGEGKDKNISNSKNVTLIATLPIFEYGFKVIAFPDTQTVKQGDPTSYKVFVLPNEVFNELCTLSVDGLPSGATASFDINPVRITEDTSTLTINTLTTTPAGEYDIAIIATGHPHPKPKDRTHVKLIVDALTGVRSEPNQLNPPDEYTLYQNYPNPFNASTTIKFFLKENVQTSVMVYNILGQKVRTLMQNRSMNRGTYEIVWDGKADNGREVPSGIYFCGFKAGSFNQVNKIILLK